jgi:hypothetical protein
MTARVQPPDVSGLVDAACAAADAVEGRTRGRGAPAARQGTPVKPSAIVSRMAEEIAARAGCDGCCTIEDLRAAGFTNSEIVEYIDDARRLFRERVIRDVHHAGTAFVSPSPLEGESLPPTRSGVAAKRPEGGAGTARQVVLTATADQLAAIDRLITAVEDGIDIVIPPDSAMAADAERARAAYAAMLTGRAP